MPSALKHTPQTSYSSGFPDFNKWIWCCSCLLALHVSVYHLMVCAMLVRGVEANGRKPVWCRLDQTCIRKRDCLFCCSSLYITLTLLLNIYLPRLPSSQSDKAVDARSDHIYWRVNNGGQPVRKIKHILSFSLLMQCLVFMFMCSSHLCRSM